MCDVRLCVYVGQLGDDQLFELFGSIVYACCVCAQNNKADRSVNMGAAVRRSARRLNSQ
jgi:hypothetical protein